MMIRGWVLAVFCWLGQLLSAQNCACTDIYKLLDTSGGGVVTPEMVIANPQECDPSQFTIELMDASGQPLEDENGNTLPVDSFRCNHVGQEIMASLINTDVFCMVNVTIEDKAAPNCQALPDITLQCDEPSDPMMIRRDTLVFAPGEIGRGITGANQRYRSIVNSSQSGRIIDLSLYVDLQFDDLSGLAISLFAPDGSFYRMINQNASCTGNNLNVNFSPSGNAFDCAALTGTIQPELADLTTLFDTDKAGNWELAATDYNGSPYGFMDSASLIITYDLMPESVDNCNVSTTYSDDESGLNECHIGTLVRTFTVTDPGGMTASCSQTITFENDNDPPLTIEWPADTVFACDADYDLSATIQGAGVPVIRNTDCSMAGYALINEELYNVDTPGCITILRFWRVRDWCSDRVWDIPSPQEIKVMDFETPELSCPDHFVRSVGSDCTLDLNGRIPPASATDNCDTDVEIEIAVQDATGNILSEISSLPIGDYTVLYTADDGCGNDTTCQVALTVVDDEVPSAICDTETNVSLNGSGQASLCWQTIDDGSRDNCAIDSIRISRDSVNFSACIDFNCEDIYAPVEGWMKVWDASGNTNICDFTVFVADSTSPVITECADDIAIRCWQDQSDTTLTGLPRATDNCDSLRYTFQDDNSGLDACGLGDVIRTHTVTDAAGRTTTCNQVITVEPVESISVNFPRDTTVECLLRAGQSSTGIPEILNDSCSNYGIRVVREDTLGNCSSDDYRIEREWLVQHNCLSSRSFSETQMIMIIDTTPPMITDCPTDMTVMEGPDNVNLSVTASDNCGEVSIRNNALDDFGQGNGMGDASGTYSEGVYDIRFIAEDECGNTDTCDVRITVVIDFDLSLNKSLISIAQEYNTGDTLEFLIEVDNEGEVDAFDVDISDTIPAGLEFDVDLNPMWSSNGSILRTTIDGPIAPGDAESRSIFFIASSSFDGLCYENEAEIADATNASGGTTASDNDSTPGNNDETEDDYGRDFAVSTVNLSNDTQRECANDAGEAEFLPTASNDSIYMGSEPVNITYHLTQADADNNTNAVTGTYTTSGDTLYARIESRNNAMCYATRLLILEAFCSTPVFSDIPDDLTVMCDAIIPDFGPDPTLMDTCGALLTIMDDSIPGNCPQEYELIRRWTAENECGNSAQVSQSINVVDNTAPVISGVTDMTVDEGEFVTLIATTTDNCAPEEDIEINNDAPVGNGMEDASGVYPLGSTVVEFMATDPCGNSATVRVTVTVVSMLMAVTADTTIYLENNLALTLDPESFDRGSIGNNLSYSINRNIVGCPHLGLNDLLFIAEDESGRKDTAPLSLTLLPDGLPLNMRTSDLQLPASREWEASPETLLASVPQVCEDNVLWMITPDRLDCNDLDKEIDFTVRMLNANGEELAFVEKRLKITDPAGYCQSSRTTAMIAGDIATADGQAMQDVQITLMGLNKEVVTDSQGHYELPELPTGYSYTLTAKYNKGKLHESLSTIDLVRIRRHILSLEKLDSPYKMIAADVNRSESVTTFDLSLIRRAILRIIDEFPGVPQWDFIPSSHEFEYPDQPFYYPIPRELFIHDLEYNAMNQNFVMVKMGDVTGFSNSRQSMAVLDPDTFVGLKYRKNKTRNSIEIFIDPLETPLFGMQFAIELDRMDQQLHSAVGELKGLTPSNVYFDQESGRLRFSWDEARGVRIHEKTKLLEIFFENEHTLSECTPVLSIADLKAEAYGINNSLFRVELLPSGREVNNQKALILYQNKPNPVKGTTFIGFELGGEAPVQLEIFDTDGQLLYSDKRIFSSGYGEFKVRASELKQKGVLFYKVSALDITLTKKMITIR